MFIFHVKIEEMLTLVNSGWWQYDSLLYLSIFLYLTFFFKKTQRMLGSAACILKKKNHKATTNSDRHAVWKL